MKRMVLLYLWLVSPAVWMVHGFTSPVISSINNNNMAAFSMTSLAAQSREYEQDGLSTGTVAISRASFLSATIAAVATTTAVVVFPTAEAEAADDSAAAAAALKGTKKDPAFEQCVSQCLYDCTKPKVYEGQRTRQECLPECKKQCATTKEQLMIGTPVKKN